MSFVVENRRRIEARAPHLGRALGGAVSVAPLAVASFVFGVSFGVLAQTSGFGSVTTVVMSAIAFTGSAQFAAIAVFGAGGGVLLAVVSAVSVNARYVAMGLSAGRSFRGSLLTRLVQGQFVLDESWGVAMKPEGSVDVDRLVGAGCLLYLSWVSGTAIGVMGAQWLPAPDRLGLDAAFPALFLALTVPRLRTGRARVVALVAGTLTLALTPLLPEGLPIIIAAAACALGVMPRD
jgi:4-azaleucine resistance transporter AzlC